MKIRVIEKSDNVKLAFAVRNFLIEMRVPKEGNAYAHVELDVMFDAYQEDRHIYYVFEQASEILQGSEISPFKNGDPKVCELQKIYFLPKASGKGLGKDMIHSCLDFAKANHFKQCYIETMPNMEAAQKLYLNTGFTYIDHSMGDTGHSSCPIWMIKSL
jgi:putative acetyltransferase